VSGWLREDQSIDISYETIYQQVYSNIYLGMVKLSNHAARIKKQAEGLLRPYKYR
jgi:IS30 family transposase